MSHRRFTLSLRDVEEMMAHWGVDTATVLTQLFLEEFQGRVSIDGAGRS